MRKLLVTVGAIAGIASATLAAACGDGDDRRGPDTGPSPPSFAEVTITSGPGTLAPGQSAQYTASVRMSDGTVKTAAEAGVRWSSAHARMLRADASGLVTALDMVGETTLKAAVGPLNVTTEIRAVMTITVVPEGTYRMVGTVTEAESSSLAIAGARVEVTPGAFVTSTDSAGRYKFYGVPADAQLRVTADGYLPHERSLRLTGHATEDVPLTLSGPRQTIDGPYTLAIDSANTCGLALAPALHHRSYEVVATQTGTEVVVALTEPRFRVENGRGNRFTGSIRGAVATLDLGYFDEEALLFGGTSFFGPMPYPSVVERIPDGTFLVVTGTAVITPSSGSLSGNLDGALSAWGAGFPASPSFFGACYSRTHRFTLTPR